MPGEQEDPQLAAQIQGLVEQQLGRIGVRGSPRVDGDFLILGRGASETRAEIRGTLLQWDSLPDDLRERRVQQIATLLAYTAAPPTASSARQIPGLRWFSSFAPISILALTAAAVAIAYHFLAPSSGLAGLTAVSSADASASSRAPVLDPDRERAVLAGSACDQTRSRVARGANIGPADSEGWVVELVLLRRGAALDLSHAPALSKFITPKPGARTSMVSWAPATHLTAAQRFDAEVAVNATPALGENGVSGLSLVFSGPYVVAYFTEDQRSDYFKLADALADELGATEGGLFARCASGESHQIGAWFVGSTPGQAVASLVYFMASYSDRPLLKPNVLGVLSGPPLRGHAFDVISGVTSPMDRSRAATLIGRELGVVSSRSDHVTRLSFPFRDANRATRASIGIARSLQLANSG